MFILRFREWPYQLRHVFSTKHVEIPIANSSKRETCITHYSHYVGSSQLIIEKVTDEYNKQWEMLPDKTNNCQCEICDKLQSEVYCKSCCAWKVERVLFNGRYFTCPTCDYLTDWHP